MDEFSPPFDDDIDSVFTFMDELLIRIESSIQRCGQHIQYVMGDDRVPPWAYTIGMTDGLGHPEAVVFGLDPETAMGVLNHIAERVRTGHRFDIGRHTHEVVGELPVRLLAVPDRFWEQSSLFAMWMNYYGSLHHPERYPLPSAVQLVWPDAEGRFPWDRGHDRKFLGRQPILTDLDPDDLAIGFEGAA